MSVEIIIGDCVALMAEMEPDSIDSCATDPPYGLEFMGKDWDAPWQISSSSKLFGKRDRKMPGWQTTRNPNCKTCGGRLRGAKKCSCKTPSWDEAPNATRLRQMAGFQDWCQTWAEEVYRVLKPGAHLVAFSGTRTYHRMACAIEDAGFEIRDQLAWTYGSGFPKSHNQPGGWGTALKPAWEPICLARKPLIGTVAANVLKHGTGALNIDGCRVDADNKGWPATRRYTPGQMAGGCGDLRGETVHTEDKSHLGRWPANIIHDGSEEVLAGFPETVSGSRNAGEFGYFGGGATYSGAGGIAPMPALDGDSGSAARFFYCAKATSDERGEGNNHPTVKPVELMRWLCRLITPKGGTVLDPFAGSGSTLIAADREQFNAIGCELSPEYAEIARHRLSSDRGGLLEAIEAAA